MIDVEVRGPFVLWLMSQAHYLGSGTSSTFLNFSLGYTSSSDQSQPWHLYIHSGELCLYLWMVVMEFLITSLQPMASKA